MMGRFTDAVVWLPDSVRPGRVGECLDITEYRLRVLGIWSCYSLEWRTTEEWMNGYCTIQLLR